MPEEEGKQVEQQEPEYTEDEQLAISKGWNPDKDAWVEAGNDPSDFKSAKTYLREGEMMERIQKQGKAIDRYKSKVNELEERLDLTSKQTSQMIELTKDRIIDDLKSQRKEALRENDTDAVIEIDDQIDKVKEQFKKDDAQQQPDVKKQATERVGKLINDWKKQNSWYGEDFDLHVEADQLFDFRRANNGDDVEDALEYVSEQIQKRHPEKFGKKSPSKRTSKVLPPDDNGTTSSSRKGSKSKYTVRDLDKEALEFVDGWVQQGVFKNRQEAIDYYAERGVFDKPSR